MKIDDVDEDGELIEGDNKRIGMIGLESGDDLNNALKHVGKIVKKTIPAKSEPKVPEVKISSSNEESEKKNTDIVKSEPIAKKTILSTFNLTKKKEQKIERVNNSNIDNIEQQNQKFSIRPVNIEMAKVKYMFLYLIEKYILKNAMILEIAIFDIRKYFSQVLVKERVEI